MDKGYEARKNALELMKETNSLEDLKEHKDEIISFMEESVKSSVDEIRKIINMPLSSEGIQEKVNKFMEGLDLLTEELDAEASRIDAIPGMQESFNEEMVKRLEPYVLELERLIDKFMNSIEGAFMEGFGEIFNDTKNADDGKGE
ncbi:MAG: hypothetical protein JSW28_00375 [Thermoplasmata archaeon]|nr:MAG: hypothetical protein JSW28_00375 [Thermoplasmata archaeon]